MSQRQMCTFSAPVGPTTQLNSQIPPQSDAPAFSQPIMLANLPQPQIPVPPSMFFSAPHVFPPSTQQLFGLGYNMPSGQASYSSFNPYLAMEPPLPPSYNFLYPSTSRPEDQLQRPVCADPSAVFGDHVETVRTAGRKFSLLQLPETDVDSCPTTAVSSPIPATYELDDARGRNPRAKPLIGLGLDLGVGVGTVPHSRISRRQQQTDDLCSVTPLKRDIEALPSNLEGSPYAYPTPTFTKNGRRMKGSPQKRHGGKRPLEPETPLIKAKKVDPVTGQVKKRSRISQACDHCRQRKARCPGGSPCSRCVAQNYLCVYTPIPRTKEVFDSRRRPFAKHRPAPSLSPIGDDALMYRSASQASMNLESPCPVQNHGRRGSSAFNPESDSDSDSDSEFTINAHKPRGKRAKGPKARPPVRNGPSQRASIHQSQKDKTRAGNSFNHADRLSYPAPSNQLGLTFCPEGDVGSVDPRTTPRSSNSTSFGQWPWQQRGSNDFDTAVELERTSSSFSHKRHQSFTSNVSLDLHHMACSPPEHEHEREQETDSNVSPGLRVILTSTDDDAMSEWGDSGGDWRGCGRGGGRT